MGVTIEVQNYLTLCVALCGLQDVLREYYIVITWDSVPRVWLGLIGLQYSQHALTHPHHPLHPLSTQAFCSFRSESTFPMESFRLARVGRFFCTGCSLVEMRYNFVVKGFQELFSSVHTNSISQWLDLNSVGWSMYFANGIRFQIQGRTKKLMPFDYFPESTPKDFFT